MYEDPPIRVSAPPDAVPAVIDGRVSVVISTYNRAHFIRFAIDSLLQQTVVPGRTIIIDDGSTDSTQEELRRYGDQIEVYRKQNQGKAAALNWILPSINTEFIWFFDDDDMATPDGLRALLKVHDEMPGLGFSFGSRYVADGSGILSTDGATFRPYSFSHLSEDEQRLLLCRESTLFMTASLIRTDAVRSVNGFDEALHRSQDRDMMVKLAMAYSFRYSGSPVYIVRRHDGDRGPAVNKHSSEDRIRLWAHYNQRIGFYLRYATPVDSFCSTDTGELQIRYRSALINRAWILGNKLPASYSITDIKEAVQQDKEIPFSKVEIERITSTLNHSYAIYFGRTPWLQILMLNKTIPGAEAARNLSKGIYWLSQKHRSHWSRYSTVMLSVVLIAVSTVGLWFHKAMSKQ